MGIDLHWVCGEQGTLTVEFGADINNELSRRKQDMLTPEAHTVMSAAQQMRLNGSVVRDI